jgi:hypothetical protein
MVEPVGAEIAGGGTGGETTPRCATVKTRSRPSWISLPGNQSLRPGLSSLWPRPLAVQATSPKVSRPAGRNASRSQQTAELSRAECEAASARRENDGLRLQANLLRDQNEHLYAQLSRAQAATNRLIGKIGDAVDEYGRLSTEGPEDTRGEAVWSAPGAERHGHGTLIAVHGAFDHDSRGSFSGSMYSSSVYSE